MFQQNRIYRFTTLSTIASFLLLFYALLLIALAPSMGYELSIYSATPVIFWIAIIFGLFNGFFLIALCLYDQSKMWIVGLFELIFCNFLAISLYALRGYVLYFGKSDVGTYVGLAKDVSNYGYYGIDNLYPVTSVFISQLNQLTNISILTLSKYLPSFFFIFYVLSIYCWSKALIPDRRFVLSSLLASTVIFFAGFSTSIYHQVLSVWTLPFFFYLLQKNSDYRFRFFCIILSIMYPFFHPITGIVVLLYLTVLFISEKFNLDEKQKNVSTSLLLLSFVALVAWFSQQYALLSNAKTILFQLIGLLRIPTTLEKSLYYMNRLGIMTAIRPISLMITDEIIFCLISFIVIYRILLRKERSIVQKFYKISLCFIIGNLFLLILFFSTYTHVPDRLINLNFNMMLTPPLVGYLLYKFLLNNKKVKAVLVLSLIFVSAVIAIFSLYPSLQTMFPNQQVTISDVKGMNWLIIQKNPELNNAIIQTTVSRYADLIYGCNFRNGRRDLLSDLKLPDHFGFTENNIFPIDEDRYLVITKFDVISYTEVWTEVDRFRIEDFMKVNFCTNVDKIYENGESRSYLVHKND